MKFMRTMISRALACGQVVALAFCGTLAGAAEKPAIDPEFINFGYVQNNGILPYVQFEAFTHIAPPFVEFVGDGSLHSGSVTAFKTRPQALQAGGAAQRAATKVIACVRNRGFNETYLRDVMQDPVRRTRLVNAVRDLVLQDSYCAGVNYDLEFRWDTDTRDGITALIAETRAALPNHEISVYVHATYSSDRWDIPAIIDNLDYLLYSTYDWASGNTVHAISAYQDVLRMVTHYLDAGVPPEKMVLTWASYGRRWYDETDPLSYWAVGDGRQSQGFYDTLYNTTLRQSDDGPFEPQYVRGDEVVTYSYTQQDPLTSQLLYFGATGESVESLEMKVSAARTFPGWNGDWRGVKLGGVGWWSMMWVAPYWSTFHLDTAGASFSGFDPIAGAVVKRAPYYRHIDLLVQELLKKPGQTKFQLESFEQQNPHWTDPDQSPDSSGHPNGGSTFSWLSAPAGAGRPAGTTLAGRLHFSFTQTSGNRVFLRYEMLNHQNETNVIDTQSALALVSKNTRVTGHYYVTDNYSNRTLRLAALDGQREVEVSNPIPLPSGRGWHTFSWDLNDDSQVNAWTTSEPNFLSGNGTIDVSQPGAREVSFLGFIVEGGGIGSGNIYFDELTYEDRAPAGQQYVINEFRYGQNNSEFVEVAGPPGPVPPGLQLVTYRSSDGAVYKAVPLGGQTIPASGLLVIGDAGVAEASSPTGFVPPNWSNVSADLPPALPAGLQLYDNDTGYVYDSVVYGAFGGVAELARIQTRRVAGEGYGWMGNLGNGTDAAGRRYTMGRLPDGADTNHNLQDFSFMPATPGTSNGGANLIDTETPWDFEAVPPGAFQTYQQIRLENPRLASLPSSPSGGRAYRTVDTTGGGVIGVFGDAEQGGERGLDITGEIYIPGFLDSAQAVAVGFCGTKGSTFFGPTPENSGYEDGYWLVYENGDPQLFMGQPKRPGMLQFVMASHDNLDDDPTTLLGLAVPSVFVPGTWTTFRLRVDPTADAAEQLVAQLGGQDVYRGPIPAEGPTRGAFMTGYREARDGVSFRDGTWIDNLSINYATTPTRVIDYHLY